MTSGFGHFDDSHRENFCAAILLLLMEVEDDVKTRIGDIVRAALGITEPCELVSAGREARLANAADDDEGYARVDLWLLYRSATGHFHPFIEVKTHDRWDASGVAAQVHDQAARPRLVRNAHAIRGSVLLAPAPLCDRVRAVSSVPVVPWTVLMDALRTCSPHSRLVQHALRHLEEHVDRSVGIAGRSLADFEQATTTVACLREFLAGCIADIGGSHAKSLNTTPGDGQPFRWSGWAWHGLSVSFTRESRKYRLGIYKYIETPAGEEAARETPWLELYEGASQEPLIFLPFAPSTLAATELETVRDAFRSAWHAAQPASLTGTLARGLGALEHDEAVGAIDEVLHLRATMVHDDHHGHDGGEARSQNVRPAGR